MLYLTIFAALRLYHLLPPTPAFGLLLCIAVLSAALAMLQNSQTLAILGASGGFLAPVLASTGEGSHVMLFSYYVLLNLGIFGIAWFKAWRPLNLAGFLFTFGIGLIWGAKLYRPEFFGTTEPFLVVFYLMYPLTALQFDWDAGGENAIIAVHIEGSDDLDHWRAMGDTSTLAKLETGGQSLVRDTAEFPSAKPKYLRITFPNAPAIPKVTAIRARRGDTAVKLERSWKDLSGKSPNKGETDFDLGGQMPVYRVQLSFSGGNAILPAEVLSRRKDSDPWTLLSRQTFYRIEQGALTVTNPDLSVAVSRHRYWRVRAVQPSAMPEPLTLRAGWLPERLVFVAQGEAPFRLVYGNAGAPAAALPIENIVPGYGTDRAPHVAGASLGDQQVLAGPIAQAARVNYKTAALWAALVLGVALLGWMAWSLTRQMKR